ncbi:SCO family protein [Trebonia kvetii]|uniref:SCO family protein n=2 Tax=Trebonia kvetii TaxID=2480626 RepID=A0A6P2BXZ0_9ACTN|nr:SCO family protein [Trebonia kvetii]
MVLINTSKYKGNIITPVTKPVGTLTDDLGKPFSIKNDTAGVVTLLFFGYTHCPDECPLTMSNTGAAFRMIPAADRAKIRVLFVSVDPGRDTPARLRSWLGNFNPAFIGLRGSLAQVEALEKQTGLPIGQTFKDSAGEAQLDHATEMFAFSTDNVATEAFFPSTPPANMANDLKLLVAGGKPS